MRRMITNKQIETINLAEELISYIKIDQGNVNITGPIQIGYEDTPSLMYMYTSVDAPICYIGMDEDGLLKIGTTDDSGDYPGGALSFEKNGNTILYSGDGKNLVFSGDGNISLTSDTVNIQDSDELNYLSLDANNGIEIYVENGYFKLMNIPQSDPEVVGAVWVDNGVLKISAGE